MKRTLAFLLSTLLLCGTLFACTPVSPPPTDPPSPPVPPVETSLTFCGDFRVSGSQAEALEEALCEAGIPLGGADATKVIYVGEDEDSPAAARENATAREECYNDFAILCDGASLALYGGSDFATREAIAYLIEHYGQNGGITVPKELSYTSTPALKRVTVAGRPLSAVTASRAAGVAS